MIKKIYTLNVLIWILVVFAVMSCNDYLDINEDPNNPTTAPLTGLMARTSFETGDNVQNLGSITAYYVQQLASPNPSSSTDVHDAVPYDQTWFELYDVMTDLSDMIILAEEKDANSYLGVAKILQAYNLGLTVDAWGGIPYTEAFFAQTLTPSYDTDEFLYAEIQRLLDEGIAAIESGTSTFELGKDDFIFQGDLEKWVKTGHALKARYLLHLSETSAFNASAVLSEVNKSYTSNDDDASVEYFTENRNSWATVAINNANLLLGGWISEQIIQAMDGTTYGVVDPRMPYMFGATDTGEFVGTENGAGRGTAAAQGERSTLVTNTFYADITSPIELITYSELKFIEAEAAFSSDPNRAYAAYLDGIRSHFEKLGVDVPETDAYLADPAVAVGSAALTRELILKEKYIALFLNPEAWNDARRFDYQYAGMTLPANHNEVLGGEFVRRLMYPESETGRNADKVPDVTTLTKLWWDQ